MGRDMQRPGPPQVRRGFGILSMEGVAGALMASLPSSATLDSCPVHPTLEPPGHAHGGAPPFGMPPGTQAHLFTQQQHTEVEWSSDLVLKWRASRKETDANKGIFMKH